jgi:hypothetical protein
MAGLLIELKHYDQARTKILRAIECKSQFGHAAEPWTSFKVLQQIESAQNNPKAAKSAWQKTTQAYLAYRQQGGYAQHGSGKLADDFDLNYDDAAEILFLIKRLG